MHFLALKILTQYNLLAPQKDTCSNIIKWLGSIDKPPAYLQKVSSIKRKVIKCVQNFTMKIELRSSNRVMRRLMRESLKHWNVSCGDCKVNI